MRYVIAVRYSRDIAGAERLAQAIDRLMTGAEGIKRVLTSSLQEASETARAIGRQLGARPELCEALLFEDSEYDLQYDHARNLAAGNCDVLVVVMTGAYSPAGILDSFRREWQFEPVELIGIPYGAGIALSLLSGDQFQLFP